MRNLNKLTKNKMKDRILSILERKQMSAAQFADSVGIQRSTFHHIISGRNKPSVDIIAKIYATYPDIDLGWLITGENQKDNDMNANCSAVQRDLFSDVDEDVQKPENPIFPPTTGILPEYQNPRGVEEQGTSSTTHSLPTNCSKKIAQIIVVFSDGTTEFYK